MESTDYLVIPYLLMFLALGSALIHYISFKKKKVNLVVKEFKKKYK